MIITTNGINHDHEDHGAHEAALHGYARSPHYETLEKKERALTGATCVISGHRGYSQWHHAWVPFHFARYFGRWELEFSKRNLIWLEQTHGNEIHRVYGHCLFFQSYNPQAVPDLPRFKGWRASQIENDRYFQTLISNRPKSLRDLTVKELTDLKDHIEKVLPPVDAELVEFAKYKPQ